MILDINTIADIVRPYNEKLIAEARVERLERVNAQMLAALQLVAKSSFLPSIGTTRDAVEAAIAMAATP